MATVFAPISPSRSPGRHSREELEIIDLPTASINMTPEISGLPTVSRNLTQEGDTNVLGAGTALAQQIMAPPHVAPVEREAEDGVSHPPIEISERRVTLQSFEGTVQSVRGEEFDGVLFDLTDKTRPEEVVSFSFDEVSEQDRGLVSAGSVFYWFIGYDVSRSGQLTRTSRIRFRRLPAWTPSRLRSLRTQATQRFADIFKPTDAI